MLLNGFLEKDFEITEGKEHLKVTNGYGPMRHAFCTNCSGPVYQKPEGAPFSAFFPVSFQITAPDENAPSKLSLKLPEALLPKFHCHYESRLVDATDDLPKFLGQAGESPLVNNDGSLKA